MRFRLAGGRDCWQLYGMAKLAQALQKEACVRMQQIESRVERVMSDPKQAGLSEAGKAPNGYSFIVSRNLLKGLSGG